MNIRLEDNIKLKNGKTTHVHYVGDDFFICTNGEKHAFDNVIAINGAVVVDMGGDALDVYKGDMNVELDVVGVMTDDVVDMVAVADDDSDPTEVKIVETLDIQVSEPVEQKKRKPRAKKAQDNDEG